MLEKPNKADFYGWDRFLQYVENEIGPDEDNEWDEWKDTIIVDWWPIWRAAYIAGVNN